MMGRCESSFRRWCMRVRTGFLHVGLTLLLIMPQPAATASLVLRTAGSIPENLETRPSEEHLHQRQQAAEAPRCRRCIYLPVRRWPGDLRAVTQARVATSIEFCALPYPDQRRDQLGAGVRSIC